MKRHIRELNKKDSDAFKELHYYCFYRGYWEYDSPKWDQYFEIVPWKNCLGYFDGEKLVSTFMFYNFPTYIRGKLMNMAAVTGIATSPEYRRRGVVEELIEVGLNKIRQNNQFVSALYPFKYEFYRRYGYEVCTESFVLKAQPENINIPKGFSSIEIKKLGKGESYSAVLPLRKKIGEKYNTILFESKKIWEFYNFRTRDDEIFAVIDEDEIVGYFIARLEKMDGGVKLNLRETYSDRKDVTLSILSYCKNHVDQVKEFEWQLMGDEPFTDYFLEHLSTRLTVNGSAMFRIIDAECAIRELAFPKNLECNFSLRVKDDFTPWNNKDLEIEIKQGIANICIKKKHKPDLDLSIQKFSQLFLGYRTIDQLVESNEAIVSEEILPIIDKVFPKKSTRLLTRF